VTSLLKVSYNEKIIELVKGDITLLEADAIVNAANKWLKHGGGVAAAIVRRGGEIIQKESNKIIAEYGPLDVGDAVETTAGMLKAKSVIHTVGPVYGEGEEKIKLWRATTSSLKLADDKGYRSIAFPAISTGVYSVPPELAAEAMIEATLKFLDTAKNIERVIFCLFENRVYSAYEKKIKNLLKEGVVEHYKD
jgi:O-acetyl-ADP-ribose deacetylase (regulator of RNase III)